MFQDGLERYRDSLTDTAVADSQELLDQQQRQRGLFFGERPLCTVLRPRFLTIEQFRFLCDRVGRLLPAFEKIHQVALADPAFRRQFMLSPEEDELVQHDPGFPSFGPTSRLDAFYVSDNELKFTEYNAETPAGAAYNDALTQVFLGLPIMRAFARHYRMLPLPARPGVANALLDAFAQWSRSSAPPRIAILDWREVPTYSEFLLFADYFRSLSLECVIADPREVEYRAGMLYAGDFHITLIYKRVLISELIERGGLGQPVVRAVRDGAACMVNPFRCKILYKKASFAVLSDERNARLFSATQHQAITEHIPWTRRVEERRTQFHEQPVDLVPFILANRERLALKPNDDYGGKGIVLGWTVDATAWEQAVQTALATPYVVQERIRLPSEPYPSFIDGQLQWIDRLFDTAPFVTHGASMDACLTRISTAALLNVTAGGGSTVPTFLVEKR